MTEEKQNKKRRFYKVILNMILLLLILLGIIIANEAWWWINEGPKVSISADQSTEDAFQAANTYYKAYEKEIKAHCACPDISPVGQKALDLYTIAAELGHAEAQFKLSNMHLLKEGIPYNMDEGVKWHKKAAEQNHVAALHNMGSFYAEGVIVKKDLEKSYASYEKAAKLGFAPSQFYLAELFYKGDGAEKDLIKSYAWVDVSIPRLKEEDLKKSAIELRDNLTNQNLTTEELEQAKTLAQKYHHLYVEAFAEGE